MADRKLYNLVNGEFVLNGMPSVHVPTYEEVKGHIDILRNVGFFDDAEMPEPVTFTGESNGRRTTEKQASVYDAMLAEIYAERNRAKARRVRKPDNRTRAERLADWEKEKDRRKSRKSDHEWKMYCSDWRAMAEGMTHTERVRKNAEKFARVDWELEQRDAELEAEYAEWEARREWEDMCRKLNDWLKYA